MRRRGDAQRRLDHATDHHEHPVCARGRDHTQRLTQRSALGKLDVDAVDLAGEARNVGRNETALVDDHRKVLRRRHAPHFCEPVEIVRHEGLLEKLDAIVDEHRNHLLGAG